MKQIPTLGVIFGDQLDRQAALLSKLDKSRDRLLMLEVRHEATYLPKHKKRLVLLFSAMRHYADWLRDQGWRLTYVDLRDPKNTQDFEQEITRHVTGLEVKQLTAVQPGDWRVQRLLKDTAAALELPLSILRDTHFLASAEDFQDFAEGRKTLVLENFYRQMRKRTGILMEGKDPVGGQWNFDADNRQSFGKQGPGAVPRIASFRHDAITRDVIDMVNAEFPEAPGSTDGFDYPVTAEDADRALDDFITQRLGSFGDYQDAMAKGHAFLWHSRLAAAMNLKLLSPQACIDAALAAYAEGAAPLNAVEGFIRQILGWREFIRGIYWLDMPGYAQRNALDAQGAVPNSYWTGETEMSCIAESAGQLIEHAYAHHIQRLMVFGLFALNLGVHPYRLHEWHMAMYLDAVDWVSLPNVLGMSQHADGGLVGTKPYTASGNYIDKMSDYCSGCRFNPKKASGPDACPVTVSYWDFLARHEQRFRGNRRMGFQYKNLDRKTDELPAIRKQADQLRSALLS